MPHKSVTYTEELVLRSENCIDCGVIFAFPRDLYDALQQKGERQSFYCPNGHPMVYTANSIRRRIAALEAEKTALQARVNSEREAREKAERKAKRMERRAAAGVCPYCNRSFNAERLQRHIHTKHPEQAHA